MRTWCPQRESNLQLILTMDVLYHLTIGALALFIIPTNNKKAISKFLICFFS